MPKFRSKPVVIEAMLWDGVNRVEIAKFIKGDKLGIDDELLYPGDTLIIRTLEGNMTASPGDWIIKGTRGEFYPCKPDVFETKYEPVD